jgi:hypothetical protein
MIGVVLLGVFVVLWRPVALLPRRAAVLIVFAPVLFAKLAREIGVVVRGDRPSPGPSANPGCHQGAP